MTRQQIKAWFEKYTRRFDSFPYVPGHHKGTTYDVLWFHDSLFQIVVECMTSLGDQPWLTEKTWNSIANKQPFIMHGDIGSLEKLESMGFRTFRSYLEIPDYNEIQDLDQRISAIVQNCKHWLGNIKSQKKSVQQDINHNFETFKNLAAEQKRIIKTFIHQQQLDCEIDQLVPMEYHVYNRLWVSFYNNVKDSVWPDCRFANDYMNLPLGIKHELQHIHNLETTLPFMKHYLVLDEQTKPIQVDKV